jgi:hypothetical protein
MNRLHTNTVFSFKTRVEKQTIKQGQNRPETNIIQLAIAFDIQLNYIGDGRFNQMKAWMVWMVNNTSKKTVLVMATSRDSAMVKAENTNKGYFAVDADQE